MENFFGGDGRYHTKIEGREFTPTELSVVTKILSNAFADMKEAWRPVLQVEFEQVGTEVNPQFANIVSPTEVVVVSTFNIELEGGGGDVHVTFPYSMLEPIRDLLDAGVQSDRGDQDDRWVISLRDEIESAEVEIKSSLPDVGLSVRQLNELKVGDIIPIELPDTVMVECEEIPIFKGKIGVSRGNSALKVDAWLTRPDDPAELAKRRAQEVQDEITNNNAKKG